MLRRIKALIWLRSQILMTNKNLIAQMLLPYMLVYLYKNFMGTETNGFEIMFVCLSTAISMSVGSMISTIIAEEKEKNNLQTLLLSGVRYQEYIISVLFHPIIVTLFTMLVFPVITEVNLNNNYVSYIVVTLGTSCSVMLINLCIGLISETQSKAQINSLPILFIVSLLPMLSGLKEGVKQVVDYTFMAAYTDFFTMDNFQLGGSSMKVLVLWNVILIALAAITIKNSRRIDKTSKPKIISKTVTQYIS